MWFSLFLCLFTLFVCYYILGPRSYNNAYHPRTIMLWLLSFSQTERTTVNLTLWKTVWFRWLGAAASITRSLSVYNLDVVGLPSLFFKRPWNTFSLIHTMILQFTTVGKCVDLTFRFLLISNINRNSVYNLAKLGAQNLVASDISIFVPTIDKRHNFWNIAKGMMIEW